MFRYISEGLKPFHDWHAFYKGLKTLSKLHDGVLGHLKDFIPMMYKIIISNWSKQSLGTLTAFIGEREKFAMIE